MKIEEEIKQALFKSEFQKLVINLKFTSGWVSGFLNKALKNYGLSPQQFNVLRILKGQYPKPSSLILIRERMLDKESNASRLIDKLEKAKLTKRVQCPEDRRQVDITITDKGIRLLNEVNPKVDEVISEVINLNEEDARKLNLLLDKLRETSGENIQNELVFNAERGN
jgi:DNA-binding MarR family transcriptional regulator